MAATDLHPFCDLPVEILRLITKNLANRDIKSLRLTCRALGSVAPLRLTRVFLSANPRNISVLRAIADHEVFRKGVTELIWDDARWHGREKEEAEEMSGAGSDNDSDHLDSDDEDGIYERETGCPRWFRKMCESNVHNVIRTCDPSVDYEAQVTWAVQEAAHCSLRQSWEYYQDLLQQQEGVLASDADVEAFEYALERFPGLRRIVLTPFAHGWCFTPVYDTLLIDTRDFGGGLSCAMFEQPCAEYNNLLTLLRCPGFARLDLALIVGMKADGPHGWLSLGTGYLRRGLAEAKDLQHFSFRTNLMLIQPRDDQFVPLQTLFPVEQWSSLRHFELSDVWVRHDDLIALLAALPPTLRSVRLSFIRWTSRKGGWRSLLIDIRDRLAWQEREETARPRVAIGFHTFNHQYSGWAVWIETEANDFIYNHGPNPLADNENSRVVPVCADNVGVLRDEFHRARNVPSPSTGGKGCCDLCRTGPR